MRTTSRIAVGSNSISNPSFEDFQQISAVSGFGERTRQPLELLRIDIAGSKRNFLRTADLQSLTRLNRFDEHRCLQQRFVSPGVEPCDAAPKQFHPQRSSVQVSAIDIGDFQLA